MKPKVVKLNDEQCSIVDEISEYTGIVGFSNVIRYVLMRIIVDLREDRSTAKPPRRTMTPEEKAQRYLAEQEARRKAREEVKLAEKRQIADLLGGTVFDAENGNPHVRYTTYEVMAGKVMTYEQVEPLSMLTQEHVENQYKPDKATVEAALKNNE